MSANENGAAGDSKMLEASGVLDDRCWLQCMKCDQWRCVDRRCVPVLDGSYYYSTEATDLDWETWLGNAAARYEVFKKMLSPAGGLEFEANDGGHTSEIILEEHLSVRVEFESPVAVPETLPAMNKKRRLRKKNGRS